MRRLPLFLFLLSGAWRPLYALDAPAVEARLTQANGDVSVLTSTGDAEGRTVPGEMLLVEGDRVNVGSQGSAEISLDGLTLIRLEPGSNFRIKSLAAKGVVLGLESGALLAKVKFEKKQGASFSVETPTVVAAVRGTEFVVQQEFAGARVGVLDEGHVLVTGRGSKEYVMLHYDQETLVQRGMPPEKAHHLDHLYRYKGEMSKMRERIPLLHKHWNALTPEQRQMVREAWVKTHPRTVAPSVPLQRMSARERRARARRLHAQTHTETQ